jgi:HK97 family phage major capsid protein
MADYRELEKEAGEIRSRNEALLAKGAEMTAEDRDQVMRDVGRMGVLEEVARSLRDTELETMRATVAGAPVIPGAESPEKAFKGDLRHFMETGEVRYSGMPEETRAALIAGTGANGGFVVPEPVHAPLIEKYRRHSPLIQDCTLFPMNGNTTMYLPFKATHGVVTSTTEAGARSEQSEPTFTGGAASSLQAFDYYTDQRASQTFLDDVPDAEQMYLDWIYEDFLETMNQDAAVGAGSGSQKLAGIFLANATYQTTLSGSAAAITNTGFLTQFFKLPIKYRQNAKWYLSSVTLATAMGFAYPNLNNTPLVVPNPTDGSFSILGKPVVEVDDAPAVGATAYPIAFGDLSRGYAVGIHKQPVILRDPFTAKPNVIFYGLGRFGGIPWDPYAVVLQKSNNA